MPRSILDKLVALAETGSCGNQPAYVRLTTRHQDTPHHRVDQGGEKHPLGNPAERVLTHAYLTITSTYQA
ncbi:hypothetical protein ACX8Z7_16190, partial [Glutamicibacter endophyticus]